jgi:hypothetical protein
MLVGAGRKKRALFGWRLRRETECSIAVKDIGKYDGMQMPNVWC